MDAFQGVIPENKIIEFIEKCLGEKINEDHNKFYTEISNLFSNNEYEKAKDVIGAFLAEHPNEHKSFALYIECLMNLELYNEIDSFSEALDEEVLKNNFVKSAIQKANIKKKNSNGPSLIDLKSKFTKDPNNIENIINLADKYFAENMLDETFELLLINFIKNREKIKIKFLEYFNALGNENVFTIKYRKKLSSIMFA